MRNPSTPPRRRPVDPFFLQMPARRRWLLAVPGGALLASPLALVGCGGGGGDQEPEAPTARATLDVPAALPAQELTVVGSGGEAPAQGRNAAIAMADEAPALVSVVHSSDRLVALGLLRAKGQAQTLDARSSAEALLFMALGGPHLQAADRVKLIDLVRQDPHVAPIADAIGTRWATDPFALDEPHPSIAAAVQSALASMRSAGAAPRKVAQRARASAAAADTVQPLQRIEPGDAVAGVTTLQADGTDGAPGLRLMNEKRRAGIAHVYKVSYTPEGGTPFDLALAEPLYEVIDVPSTQNLSGFSALADLFLGTAPWSPVQTARYGMPMHPGAELTKYEMVYVTPVYDRPEPDFFSEVRYSLLRNDWREELRGLYTAVQMELVFGAIFEALGLGAVPITRAGLAEAIAQIEASATSDVVTLLEQAGHGTELLAGMRGWLLRLSSNEISILGPGLRDTVAKLVQEANAQFARNLSAGNLSKARLVAFRATLRAIVVIYVVAGVFDTGALYLDLHTGEPAHLVTSTLVAPKVLVSPSSGSLSRGAEIALTARVTGAQDLTLTYHWALTGSDLANLSDGAGHIGAGFDSDLATVTLATTPSTTGTLTVKVEAFQVKTDGSKVSLGSATSSLTMDATVMKLSPSRAEVARTGGTSSFVATLDPPPSPGTLVQFEWQCLSQYGALASGGSTTSAAATTIVGTSNTATYTGRSNNDGGTFETIAVQAFHLDGEGRRVDIGSGASAEVFILQQYNLLLLPGDCDMPLNTEVTMLARVKEDLPTGATVRWTWDHGGAGTFTPPAPGTTGSSQATLNTGATEGTATVTVQAVISVPGQADFRPLPVTRALNVKRDLRTVTLAGAWVYEIVWGESYTFYGCGTESNPVGLCRPCTLYFNALIPKVAGAKTVTMTLDRPTPDPLHAISFPSTWTASSGHWTDRGGYWVQNLSSVGVVAGENGVQPGASIASETARFEAMTVTVNVGF